MPSILSIMTSVTSFWQSNIPTVAAPSIFLPFYMSTKFQEQAAENERPIYDASWMKPRPTSF